MTKSGDEDGDYVSGATLYRKLCRLSFTRDPFSDRVLLRDAKRGVDGIDICQRFSVGGEAKFAEPIAHGTDSALVAADGVIIGLVGT